MAETTLKAIQWGVIIGVSLIAAVIDVRTRRIPNQLCGPLFLAGLLWSLGNYGFKGLGVSLAAMAILSLPFVIMFLFGGGGAGDAKLTGAIGAWLTVDESLITVACILIAGGVIAIIIAVYKKKLKFVLMSVFLLVFDLIRAIIIKKDVIKTDGTTQCGEKLTIPYGVAIFAGLCVAGGIIWLR